MSDTIQPLPDIAKEILALAPKTEEQAANVPTPPESAKPLPSVVAPASAKDFFVGEKVCKPHQKLLADGVHPRDIQHIAHGRWRGCQCLKCKTKRGEMVQTSAIQSSPEDVIANSFKEIVDEDLAAIVFDTPTRAGLIFCQLYDTPKEIQKVWETPEKELKTIGRLGKMVSDRYLNLPEVKHKEAWALGTYMFSQFSVRLGATIAMLKIKALEKKQ